MREVSEYYLLGVSEGRALHRSLNNPSIEEMRACLSVVKTLLSQKQSREMRETYQGEKDFWEKQIEKAGKA